MKITDHVISQIGHAKENGIDLTDCVLEAFEGDEERPYLVQQSSGDPIPPGNPPPVPPK